jgi:hypothetical protein
VRSPAAGHAPAAFGAFVAGYQSGFGRVDASLLLDIVVYVEGFLWAAV